MRLCHGMWLFHLHRTVNIRPFSPFFPLAESRNLRLRHFAGYPFGASRKKIAAVFYGTAFRFMTDCCFFIFAGHDTDRAVSHPHLKMPHRARVNIRETAPHRPGKRLYGALFYCWNNPLETQIPQDEASGTPTKKRCARQRLPAFAGVSSLALSLPVLAASEGKHTKNPLFQHDKKYAFGGGQP